MAKESRNKMSSHEDARLERISDRNQCVVRDSSHHIFKPVTIEFLYWSQHLQGLQ